MHSNLIQRKQAYRRGQRGEWIAALYLRCKGYKILKTRLKTPVGEIDLLVQKGNALIAVEVKRRKLLEKAAFSITPFQQRRIERALLYYLVHKPVPQSIRCDVILIGRRRWPRHIKGAWGEF